MAGQGDIRYNIFMVSSEIAIEQLDVLLNQYEEARQGDHSGGKVRDDVLANRLIAAIERLTLSGSAYARQVNNYRGNPGAFTRELYAIASALRDDLRAGWLSSLVELVHADTYNDFLEMAEGLLTSDYKDAAAVIIGSSLEVHVRSLCTKHGVDTDVSGKPRKADVMNADLKKAGVYGTLEQKRITAWLDLRNSAAHGEYAKYDKDDVRRLARDVRDFAAKYPA